MTTPVFHHCQVTVADIEQSRPFYRDVLGLTEIRRPTFPFSGAWFQLPGSQELHIVTVPDPLWRPPQEIQIYETHVALRVRSFREALERLRAHGYHEDYPKDHPLTLVIKTRPQTGYPQVYFFDPDRHLCELNAPALDID